MGNKKKSRAKFHMQVKTMTTNTEISELMFDTSCSMKLHNLTYIDVKIGYRSASLAASNV